MRTLLDWLIRTWRGNWLFILLVGGIVAAFMVLRTPASAVGSVDEVDVLLHDGQPTLVEFYSNT
jgi:hypothetical protein